MIYINFKNIKINSASNNAGVFIGQNFQIWDSFTKSNTNVSGNNVSNSINTIIDNDGIDSTAVPVNYSNGIRCCDGIDGTEAIEINQNDSYNDGSRKSKNKSSNGRSDKSSNSNHTNNGEKANNHQYSLVVDDHKNNGRHLHW